MELVHTAPAPARHAPPPQPNSGLVVVQAAAIEMSPQRLLQTLRQLGALRVVLVGPEFGSLAHRLALDLGFDEVWPAGLPDAVFAALLAKAWTAPRAAASSRVATSPPPTTTTATTAPTTTSTVPAPVTVDLPGGTCSLQGRVLALPQEALRLLDGLRAAYPATAPRAVLAGAAGGSPGRRIDMVVCRLRQALRATGIDDRIVQSVRGAGYRLSL